MAKPTPWEERTSPDRLPPRECIGNARDALNRAYGLTGSAPYPLLIEAVDWLRRGLEQMADPHPQAGSHYRDDLRTPPAPSAAANALLDARQEAKAERDEARQQATEAENERVEWQNRCSAAEARVAELEQALTTAASDAYLIWEVGTGD